MTDVSEGQGDEREERCRVFLCHNSRDKDVVKQVAEALALEFGIPHFLDEYAIPTGEAFVPWIEEALGESSGCAIFLGGSGWGPTHRWEAERALGRYRRDPSFKLIPVVLSGVSDDDMAALGDGSLFKDLNWADLRESLDDPEQIDKLRRALTGESAETDFGPDRLTPFLVRRAARRWLKTGQDSLLYRGAELENARRIVREYPDLVVLAETQPFIDASALRQRRFWQRLTAGLVIAVLVIASFALVARHQRDVATDRLAESQSRQLALAAPSALGPDRALVLSVEALRRAATSEARENLLGQLEHWRELRWLRRLDTDQVESLAFDRSTGRLRVGDWLSVVHSVEPATAAVEQPFRGEGHGAVSRLLPGVDGGELWIGFEDGRLLVVERGDEASAVEVLSGRLLFEERGTRRDTRVLSLAAAADHVAVGDGAGVLRIFERSRRRLVKTLDTNSFRVEDLAFDPTGTWLAVGTDSRVQLLDAATFEVVDEWPERSGGTVALEFLGPATLVVLSGYGQLSRFDVVDGELLAEDAQILVPPSCAAIDAASGWVAVGDGDGMVRVYEPYSSDPLFSRQAHAAQAIGLVFGETHEDLFSVAIDGTVAAWRLEAGSPLARSVGVPDLAPTVMRPVGEEGLLVAETYEGTAGVWRVDESGTELLLDLIEESRALAGPEILVSGDLDEVEDGFRPVEPEVVAIDLHPSGSVCAWSTLGGGVFVRRLSDPAGPTRLVRRAADAVGELRLGEGDVLAFLEGERRAGWIETGEADSPTTVIDLPAPSNTLALDVAHGLVALSMDDGTVGLWSLEDGEPQVEPRRLHPSTTTHMVFTPDGRRLISTGSGEGGDRSVAVWSVPGLSLERRLQMRQAGGSATALAVSADSRFLAVPDLNGQVLLWDLGSLSPLGELTAGGSWVSSAAYRSSAVLITASGDGSLLSWDLDPLEWARLACAKAKRSLTAEEWEEVLPGEPWEATCSEESLWRLEPFDR